jgi:hypothetical protein
VILKVLLVFLTIIFVILKVLLVFLTIIFAICDIVCQWPATGRWFFPGTPVSSTNKTDHHDITKILLKVALNTIKPTNKQLDWIVHSWLLTFDFPQHLFSIPF